jgi:hypothetical protein
MVGAAAIELPKCCGLGFGASSQALPPVPEPAVTAHRSE